ncbi:MAG: 1-deoxy-D-xylulose-5-phosphate reductoisomerase [candidate division WOR-3 bacterium]
MKVAIFGATGFLGKQALAVIKSLRSKTKEEITLFALACEKNYHSLLQQAFEFSPRFLVVYDQEVGKKIKRENLPKGTTLLLGKEGSMEICAHPEVDTIFFLASGTDLISPLLLAIEKRKKICLAGKELVVAFGKFIFNKAKEKGVAIIPVDSEISGLFQCLSCRKKTDEIASVIITSSGGPFFSGGKRKTLENCLKHPIWRMGKKITVDSATLMNKGFEVIEAVRFFSLPPEKVLVLIHPQVFVHALIQFIDGRILAQIAQPDMRIFLQYALTYPQAFPSPVRPLNWSAIKHWDFFLPNLEKFPCLDLAYRAIKKDGSFPTVLVAADEVAVSYFLQKKIKFSQIPKVIEETLSAHHHLPEPSLNELLVVEREAKEKAIEVAERLT